MAPGAALAPLGASPGRCSHSIARPADHSSSIRASAGKRKAAAIQALPCLPYRCPEPVQCVDKSERVAALAVAGLEVERGSSAACHGD